MSRDITEADWKTWKALRLRCIDQYCTQTFDRVQQLSRSTENRQWLFVWRLL